MYRFQRSNLDELLTSMIDVSNANPEMSLEDVAYQVCEDAYENVDELNHAFDSLLYIVENNSIFKIDNGELKGCLISDIKKAEIPSDVTSIGQYAFDGCRATLTNIIVPNSVTDIKTYAFFDCRNLTDITLSDSLMNIGELAFYNCKSLSTITLPNSVKSIGNSAFYYCSNLSNITIPESVTRIGKYAFYECCSLESVTIGNGVRNIEEGTF